MYDLIPKPAQSHDDNPKQDYCAVEPPKLVGPLRIVFDEEPKTFQQIHAKSPALKKGGRWRPNYCIPLNRVAIVIPYR